MRIQAAVLRDVEGPYQIEDVDLDDPKSGQVRVRVAGVGICHTDTLPRVRGLTVGPPIIAGHEGSGIVDAVGAEVTDLAVGDHVVMSYDYCRSCTNCLSAHPAYCDTFFERNLSGAGIGAPSPVTDSEGQPVSAQWFGQSSFATYANVTAANAVRVDPALPIELLGPLGCGIQTGAGAILNTLNVRAGDSVAVFGTGGVGLSAVMAAKVAGAATIIAIDLHQSRLQLAKELGATHTLLSEHLDAVLAQVRTATGGGVQSALDTTGVPTVISTAIQAVRPTGVCGLVAVQRGNLVLDPMALAVGRTVTGILEGNAVPQVLIPRLIALWRQGRFPFDRLIQTYPLSQSTKPKAPRSRGR
jgi:aryl-alcohol dehydrogenase